MDRVVIAFSSTHSAMAAEDAFRAAGIALQVIPLPSWIAARCGLAIRLAHEDRGRAAAELAERGISVRGIHDEPRQLQ